MTIRTPLRADAASVWIDSETGTVRLGALSRNRTLMAGLAPSCYLLTSLARGKLETWVLEPDSADGWQFAPNGGMAAAVRTLAKPEWCGVIESVLPQPTVDVPAWLEVGVDAYPNAPSCSIPLGTLPQLQAGLMQHGLHLTYITQLPDVGRTS